MAEPTAAPAAPAAPESVIAAPAAPAAPAQPESIISNTAAAPAAAAIAAAAKPDTPAAPTPEDMTKFLTEKGQKAEDVAKLKGDALATKYGEVKAQEDHKALLASIDVTVPEGIEIDETTMGSFKEIIADAKLSPKERAQALINLHAARLKETAEAPYKAWNKTQGEWQTQVKSDTELGGANYDKMTATIAKAITHVGGDKAAKMFEAFAFTGAGNHPEIVRAVYRMAALITEGDHVAGDTPASTGQDDKVLTAMYPSASKAR